MYYRNVIGNTYIIERLIYYMENYYDYILSGIPLGFIGVFSVLVLFGSSYSLATSLSAGFAALLIGHAMFINGPVSKSQITNTEDAANPVFIDE